MKRPALLVFGLAAAVGIVLNSSTVVGVATMAAGVATALYMSTGKARREDAAYGWWAAAAMVALGAAVLALAV